MSITFDNSLILPTSVPYLHSVTDVSGALISHTQGQDASGNQVTNTTFHVIDPSNQIQINENLTEIVQVCNDELDSSTLAILNDIKFSASQLSCSDFHGKGTIDDYSAIFTAASKIANESKQMTLDVNVDGFSEFGNAADELSQLFTGFITKLKNVNIINDLNFLTTISVALKKIVNLSDVFGQFKKTIIATSTIQIPKSVSDTKNVLVSVMSEVNCAMTYINHFVDSSSQAPEEANLDQQDIDIINQAATTINNWNILCEQGVTIAMSNNPDIQYIKQANSDISTNINTLKNASLKLRNKLQSFNFSNTNSSTPQTPPTPPTPQTP
jgi:hypothetical protein